MKNNMNIFMGKLVIISLLVLTSLPVLSETSPASSVRFTVNGLVCAFCAQGIEKRLKKIPEVSEVYVNLADKIVMVDPKQGKTLDTVLISAEIKDSGYDVTKIEMVSESVADVRKVMESKP